MQRIIKEANAIKQPEWYVLLLPLFFVLHGYVEYFEIIYLKDAAWLFIQYLAATLVVWFLFSLIYKDRMKGGVFTFLLLCFYFFFGAIHDQAKAWFGDLFITSYSFIIPFCILVYLLLFLWVRKARIMQFRSYLTLLMLLFLIIDLVTLIPKLDWFNHSNAKSMGISACDTCSKPDIYMIVADEYAGEKQLKEVAGFDNSPFYDALRKRGFHIIENSRSNYNSTPFSMASMMDMDYLQGIVGDFDNKEDIKFCLTKIKNGKTGRVFESMGYEMINNSLFNFADQPTNAETILFPIRAKIISGQTFFSRLFRDVVPTLIVKFNMNNILLKWKFTELEQNKKTINRLKNEVDTQIPKPKFVYTHLMMPHHPYYFYKDGKPYFPYEEPENDEESMKMYIEYLQYSNGVFIELIDYIQRHSKRPHIIMFLSDHGFRLDNMDKNYLYVNFNSIYLPSGDYKPFYPGMSNVNLFRVLLNESFGQRLPVLTDSAVFTKEHRFGPRF